MIRLEHIGIAVKDATKVEALYKILFQRTPYKKEEVQSESVRTTFFSANPTKLELLESLNETSAIGKFLEKRGEGLHHLAFEVEDIYETFRNLKEAGFTLLNEVPKKGADDKLIFFLHPKETQGVLIEFCQQIPHSFTFQSIHDTPDLFTIQGNHALIPILMVLPTKAAKNYFESYYAPLMNALQSEFWLITLVWQGAFSLNTVHQLLQQLSLEKVILFSLGNASVLTNELLHEVPTMCRGLIYHNPLPFAGFGIHECTIPTLLTQTDRCALFDWSKNPLDIQNDRIKNSQERFRNQFLDLQYSVFPGSNIGISSLYLSYFVDLAKSRFIT